MKTVLIYVLSCWEDPYPSLTQASLDTWESVPVFGVDTYFYFGNAKPKLSNPKIFCVDCAEGFFDVGRRNLCAFDWALKYPRWDYIARVNASCYVRKKKLVEYCQSLPDKGLFQGVKYARPDPKEEFLWGGGQFIISRDVIEEIVTNGARWNHKVMEDQAMSWIVRDLGIPWNMDGHACLINKMPEGWLILPYGSGGEGGEFKRLADVPERMFQNFIRVKQDLHRDQDIAIMKELHALEI
jgi:hypothetical protein